MKKLLKKIFYTTCAVSDIFLRDNKARVLMYHSHELSDVFFNVSQDFFLKQLDFLQKNKFIFVTISQLVSKIKNKESLRNVLAITHDDGHADYLTVAYTELLKRNIHGTLYFPYDMKNNTLITSTGVSCRLLTQDQVQELAKNSLIEIGSHSMTHPELVTLSDEQLVQELFHTNEKTFAYPRGKFGQREKEAVIMAGYESAVTTHEGFITHTTDLFEIPRISIDQTMNMLDFRAKLSTLYGWYVTVRVWIGKIFLNKFK
jgi:hypothetical protein